MNVQETTLAEFWEVCTLPENTMTQEEHEAARRALGFPVRSK